MEDSEKFVCKISDSEGLSVRSVLLPNDEVVGDAVGDSQSRSNGEDMS